VKIESRLQASVTEECLMSRAMTRVLTVACLGVAACGQLPGTTTTGGPPAAISGSVVQNQQPLAGATVVLLRKVGNDYTLANTTKADAIGQFTFSNVPPGLYRVAFDRATGAERREAGRTVLYSSGVETFGYLSTDPFTLEAGRKRQVPQMDVAWAANLSPAPDAVVEPPVIFRWNEATGALSYRIRVADAQNNTVFTSPPIPAGTTRFAWEGTSAGKRLPAGQYFWSVNVDKVQGFGGTNISPITLR
jgi:hypothetical protein